MNPNEASSLQSYISTLRSLRTEALSRLSGIDQVLTNTEDFVKANVVLPVEPTVLYDFDFRSLDPTASSTLVVDGAGEIVRSPVYGALYRLPKGTKSERFETGVKNPKALAVISEPVGMKRYYTVRLALPIDWVRFSHKVVIWQFWQVAGKSPVLSCEVSGDFIRVVKNIDSRQVLWEKPWKGLPVIEFRIAALWSSTSGSLSVSLASGTTPLYEEEGKPNIYVPTVEYPAPKFKWGIYAPVIGDDLPAAPFDISCFFTGVTIRE